MYLSKSLAISTFLRRGRPKIDLKDQWRRLAASTSEVHRGSPIAKFIQEARKGPGRRLRLGSQRGLRRIGASRERDAASASRNCAAVKADFGSRGSPMPISIFDHPVATDTRAHGERQVAKDELEIGDLQTFGRHSDFAVGREPRFLETGADRRPCVVSGRTTMRGTSIRTI